MGIPSAMRQLTLEDFLAGPVMAVIWALFAWSYARGVNHVWKLGSLTGFQKFGLVYGTWFFLGMGYILMAASAFQVSDQNSLFLLLAWAAILGLVAWWRYRRRRLRVST